MKETAKMHEKTLKTVVKGAGIAFFGLFIGKLFAYLIRVFIARNLGPDVYGLISIGVAVISILMTVSLIGFTPGITRFIAFYHGKNNQRKIKGSILSSFKITLPISIFLSCLLFIFSEKLAFFLSKPQMIPIFQFFSLAIPLLAIIHLVYSIMLGYKMIKYKVYIVDIGKNLSTFLFIAALFYLGFGVYGAIFGFLLGYLFSTILGIYYLKDKVLSQLKNIKPLSVDKELIVFSFPLMLMGMSLLLMGWTDILVLGFFEEATNVGIYSAALNTCVLLTFLLQAFRLIFMPIISELFSSGKVQEIRRIYKTLTRWLFSFIFPMFLLFIIFPDKILVLFFGSEFVSGSSALVILTFGYLLLISTGLPLYTITAIGKTKLNMYITVLAAVSNLILNLVLIPIFGIIGAAIAMTVSLAFRGIVSLCFLYKEIKIQPYDKSYLKPFFASLFSAGAIYVIFKIIFKPVTFPMLVIGFVLFVFLYMILILLMRGLTKEDIMIIKTVEKRTGLKVNWVRNIIKRFV